MSRKAEVISLYRRGLRLSRQFIDPCGRHYLVNRVMSVFRRYQYEVSEVNISQRLRHARQAVRRVGRAVSLETDSFRYVLELAYGKKGRVKHMLEKANMDAGKKKGPLHALNAAGDRDAQSAILRSAFSRVPAQWWKGRGFPDKGAFILATGPAKAEKPEGTIPDDPLPREPAPLPVGGNRGATAAWASALQQSQTLQIWRGSLQGLQEPHPVKGPKKGPKKGQAGPLPPPPPAASPVRASPVASTSGAVDLCLAPSFAEEWEARHIQLLKRVFLPALPTAVRQLPRDQRRLYEAAFEIERPRVRISGVVSSARAKAAGGSEKPGQAAGKALSAVAVGASACGGDGMLQLTLEGREVASLPLPVTRERAHTTPLPATTAPAVEIREQSPAGEPGGEEAGPRAEALELCESQTPTPAPRPRGSSAREGTSTASRGAAGPSAGANWEEGKQEGGDSGGGTGGDERHHVASASGAAGASSPASSQSQSQPSPLVSGEERRGRADAAGPLQEQELPTAGGGAAVAPSAAEAESELSERKPKGKGKGLSATGTVDVRPSARPPAAGGAAG